MSNISSISTDDRINQESVDEINYEFKYGEFIKFAILSPICTHLYVLIICHLYVSLLTLYFIQLSLHYGLLLFVYLIFGHLSGLQ